ncbi:OmpA family protein [Echinicola sp. CAU 1574]|uniref:OmpA family protein n=1 Tax=Echinicola arenosa TaxID=2774144 RepID=A0ABR9AJA6_9BACT|nr:OmpA family protein [Echinicola arenosa]MBD8488604.1 OmpA family protein [Echinicola arenosa]
MKTIFRLLFAGVVVTMIHHNAMAQNALFRYADKQYELFNYEEAAEVYVKAFEKKGKYKAAQRAAMSFQKLNDYDQSYEWWKTTVGFEEASTNDFVNFIASANQLGKMDEVVLAMDTITSEGKLDKINLDSLMSWYDKPSSVEAVGLDSLNSASADFGMVVDGQGNKYFASDRGDAGHSKKAAIRFDVSNKINEDTYEWTGRDFLTVYKMNKEGEVATVTSPVPDSYHFADPFFLEQQAVAFYTVTREVKRVDGKKVKTRKVNPEMDYGQSQDEFIDYHPEIYYSKIGENGEFSDYSAFPLNDALKYSLINPFLDENSNQLYFASDMEGGYGGFDIYVVEYDKEFNFGEPKNLGPDINTEGDERDPYLFGNNFYFSSNGHFGLGGLDIFSAKYQNGTFSNVKNMGVPYNSPKDDFAMTLSEEGTKYLSSNRSGGKGLDDIYMIKDMFRRFLGRVKDCDGALITDGFVAEFIEKDAAKTMDLDRETAGEVKANISPESHYELKISKRGYFPVHDEDINTEGMEGTLLEREYTLVPIPYKTTVFVDLVYYDLDKSSIRSDAQPILDKLASLMDEHDYLDLMVRSHTDARASDEYNDKLSNDRADAVAAYLATKGIATERVHEEWFGEKMLAVDCGDGVPCPERSHQLNRRSELVLMAFADENRDYELPEDLLDLCDQPNLGIQMNVPTIYFDFDKYNLRPEGIKQLERLLLLMNEREGIQLALEGHTDIRGSEAYNEGLSEKRAEVVRQFLVARGIDEGRVSYSWYGKTRPVHDCQGTPCTEAEHQLNRRTEIKLMLNEKNINASNEEIVEEKISYLQDSGMEEKLKGTYVITGVFSSADNATVFSKRNKDMGLEKGGFFFDPGTGLYYCYAAKYDNLQMALVDLDQVIASGFEGAWVMVL